MIYFKIENGKGNDQRDNPTEEQKTAEGHH